MTDHEKARAWRLAHALSPKDLAALIGYSVESIFWMEKGMTPERTHANSKFKQGDRAIKPWVWRRYQLACAGIDAELRSGKAFDWELKA